MSHPADRKKVPCRDLAQAFRAGSLFGRCTARAVVEARLCFPALAQVFFPDQLLVHSSSGRASLVLSGCRFPESCKFYPCCGVFAQEHRRPPVDISKRQLVPTTTSFVSDFRVSGVHKGTDRDRKAGMPGSRECCHLDQYCEADSCWWWLAGLEVLDDAGS